MPGTVLIIDDYADNRELVRLMLEQAGYTVREAASGEEGIEAARAAQPDVALVDLSMPGMDGWKVLKELRADGRTLHIPCAAVSAFADGARDRALAHGFNAYLTKPFRGQELLETVEQLLTDQKAPDGGGDHSRAEEML
ncbi:MAG TPA: response regulator [Pyrinomonadaceae bacterium]|nr:response regulator [Pyrinomonadaceae bacterium]